MCSKAGLENVAQSVFFAGCLVGVFLAGLLADYLGRKVFISPTGPKNPISLSLPEGWRGYFLSRSKLSMNSCQVVVVVLVLVMMVTGVAGGLVSSWPLWLVLRFTVGAASIGMISVRYTIQVGLQLPRTHEGYQFT